MDANKTSGAGSACAWYAVGVLTLAYTFSYIDRSILSLMVGPIRADLGLSDTQFSLLHGLAFALFYTIMGIPHCPPCGCEEPQDHHRYRRFLLEPDDGGLRLVQKFLATFPRPRGRGAWRSRAVSRGLLHHRGQLFPRAAGTRIGNLRRRGVPGASACLSLSAARPST